MLHDGNKLHVTSYHLLLHLVTECVTMLHDVSTFVTDKNKVLPYVTPCVTEVTSVLLIVTHSYNSNIFVTEYTFVLLCNTLLLFVLQKVTQVTNKLLR